MTFKPDPLPGVPSRTKRHAAAIVAAAEKHGLDPLLIAAVIDHESGGGKWLTHDGKGDKGHGHGLMQIDNRYHLHWIANNNWADPAVNIDYGTALLKSYIKELGCEDGGVCAYNAGPAKAKRALRELRPGATPEERRRALNRPTTHARYLSNVYDRLTRWRALRDKIQPKEIGYV